MNINDIKNIKKNSNGFSFTQEMLNEVNNLDFAKGEVDYLNLVDRENGDSTFSSAVDTRQSYIWSTISAITEDIGEALYQNILNYIDNVCDVDTCSVKALQSMVQILGTKFSIFDSLKNCPLEILDMINVFSMRKDYLLNIDKINSKLVGQLSCLCADSSPMGILSAEEDRLNFSIYPPYVISQQLDNVISTAFHTVLTSHVFQTYNDLCSTYIVADQFKNIQNNGFVLSSVYDQTIAEYKTKWNIPTTFDEEFEVDKIENGISSIDDYTLREQNVLSLELKKRNAATYELEPTTRYQYYRQRDVRDYIKFVEQLYGEHISAYVNSEPYSLDNSYIEIKSLSSSQKLICGDNPPEGSPYPVTIDENMLHSVEGLLVNIVNQIRGIREYLKSHAQRTYMKGTFLLIAYIINEYLNNNTIPSLKKLGFLPENNEYSDNSVQLIEYIDQTQYNNLQADIKEDVDNRDVNPVFWEGTAANGNANELDTTNIFRPADKLKLVTSPNFSYKEIENFYLNVLNNVTGQRRLKEQDRNIYDFLLAVFAVGADSSYKNSDGKLMCELQHTVETDNIDEWNKSRRFTIDIDNYVSDISAAYQSSEYILSSLVPVQNSSLRYQFVDAIDEYRQKALDEFTAQLDDLNRKLTAKIENITLILNNLEAYNVQFQNYEMQFQNLMIAYSAYFSTPQLYSSFLYDKITEYSTKFNQYANTHGISTNVKTEVQNAISSLKNSISKLTTAAIDELKKGQILLKVIYVASIYDFYTLTSTIRTIPANLQTISLGTQFADFPRTFENLYSTITTYLENLHVSLLQQQQVFYSSAQTSIMKNVSKYNSTELDRLSMLIEPYIDEQFYLTNCVEEISSRVDYQNDDWYKYKSSIFQKYTGLSSSDLPFYYIENTRHPSYQIHPCLSNFIEAINYQFPVNGLVGLAETTIRDVVKTTTSLSISNGLILSAWNNPLNSNEDYMSRYEKSNHIDEIGHVNKYFGHDGFFYPTLTTFTVPNNYDQINSNNSIFSGLNISKDEYTRLRNILVDPSKLNANSLLSQYADNKAYYILKYGLDIYDNAYMIIADQPTDKAGILWFRPKNYPTALPALVYNNNKELQSELSQFENKSTTENLETNAALSRLKMKEIVPGKSSYQSPLFADFTFSSTRKVILLNGIKENGLSSYADSIPIHAFIKQIYDDKELRYKRYLTPDSNLQSPFRETLSTDMTLQMECVCPFLDGSNIGQIYAKLSNYSGSTKTLSIDVIQYYANSQDLSYESKEISAEIAINDENLTNLSDIKFSNKQNREFSCAFLSRINTASKVNMYTNNTSNITYSTLSAQYPTYLREKYQNILQSTTNSIKTIDFQVVGETILTSIVKNYAPVNDMGFIPLYCTRNLKQQQIYGNYYEQEFDNNQTLMFECLNSSYNNAGNDYPSIDFKFICPIRVESIEDSSGISSAQPVLKFNNNVDVVSAYPITNVHVFDSYFNEYVISEEDAMFWDLTDAERLAQLSTDTYEKTLSVDIYRRLANYDVMKYLTAQREESPYSEDEHGLKANVFNEDENIDLVTEPCLISQESYDSITQPGKTHPYIYGYLDLDRYSTTGALTSYSYFCKLNSSTNLSVIVSKIGKGFKLDFNSCWYFRNGSSIDNFRNYKHLFLNLDSPGDSGYLNIYDNYTNSGRCMMTLFIKNISDEIPKFVLRKIYSAEYADESAKLTEVALDKSKRLRASNSQENVITVLADETNQTTYIEFA